MVLPLKGKGIAVLFASSGTMNRYMVSHSWQILRKKLVRSGKGPGRKSGRLEQINYFEKKRRDAGIGGGLG